MNFFWGNIHTVGYKNKQLSSLLSPHDESAVDLRPPSPRNKPTIVFCAIALDCIGQTSPFHFAQRHSRPETERTRPCLTAVHFAQHQQPTTPRLRPMVIETARRNTGQCRRIGRSTGDCMDPCYVRYKHHGGASRQRRTADQRGHRSANGNAVQCYNTSRRAIFWFQQKANAAGNKRWDPWCNTKTIQAHD